MRRKIQPRNVFIKTFTQVLSKAIDPAKCCRHGSFTSTDMATEPTVPGKLCSAKLVGACGCHLLSVLNCKRVTKQPLWGSCLGKPDGELCCKGYEGVCRRSGSLGCWDWGPAQSHCSQGWPLPHSDLRGRLPGTGANPDGGSCFQQRLLPWPCLSCSSSPPHSRVPGHGSHQTTSTHRLMSQSGLAPSPGMCPTPRAICPDLDRVVYIKLGSSWKDLLAVLHNKWNEYVFLCHWHSYCKLLWVCI